MWQELNIRRYLWQVSRELPGNRKQKKRILERVECSVREFASEHPDADYAVLEKWFGTPLKIAETAVMEMEPGELVEKLQIRRKILYIVLVAISLILTVRLLFDVEAYLDHDKDINGYAIVEVIEVERIENEGGDN